MDGLYVLPNEYQDMRRIYALASILLLSVGCRKEEPTSGTSVHRPSVLEVVVSDLVTKEPINEKFVGSKVMIISGWKDGDSMFYSLDDYAIRISDELLKALQAASESKDPFPSIEMFGPNAILATDAPLNYLEYYSDEAKPVQGKCFVSFWRPGYSRDHKHAIVRARYGPVAHATVFTYLLADSEFGWKIIASFESTYP